MDEPEAVVEEMEQDCLADGGPSLMDLPDNVLMKICQYSEPFDVLSLGMTCRRLCELTSSRFLWTSLALSWCRGAWRYLPNEVGYGPEDPKQWFCNLLRMCIKGPVQHIERALLENGETWLRIQDDRFSCKVTMLAWAYHCSDYNDGFSFIFPNFWLEDICLYKRLCPTIDFTVSKLKLDSNSVSQLATLSHAYAQTYVSSEPLSSARWVEDLFPHGPKGSICPLLACPSTESYARETSGVDGLLSCVSYVLEQQLAHACLRGQVTLTKMAYRIREACLCFFHAFAFHKSMILGRWPDCPVAHAIVSMSEEGWPDFTSCQPFLDPVGLHWREVMSQCAAMLKEHGTLDAIVDMLRIRWRRVLLSDIEAVVGPSDDTLVSRINLTDGNTIGEDNPRQAIAAAFVSQSGVLVTWQVLLQNLQ